MLPQEILVPLTVIVKLENIVIMREHALNVTTITYVPSMVTQSMGIVVNALLQVPPTQPLRQV